MYRFCYPKKPTRRYIFVQQIMFYSGAKHKLFELSSDVRYREKFHVEVSARFWSFICVHIAFFQVDVFGMTCPHYAKVRTLVLCKLLLISIYF
jgi:hypothetical protein